MMQKNKLLGFGCIAVLISSYSFVMWDLASADCFVRFIQSFLVSLLFLAGVWVCLDLINRKHNTKKVPAEDYERAKKAYQNFKVIG